MSENEQTNELQSIKRLLVLLLMKLGSSSEEIGAALDVDSSVIRRMVPARKVTKLNVSGQNPR